jgi:hypothetical protein
MENRIELVAVVAGIIVVVAVAGTLLTMFMISS